MTDQLINMFPLVRRARDFYLYDEEGRRFLDLYLDKGRAICGHRPGGLSLAFKNAISRGLYAPYPSIYSGRLVKLLKKEFPQFHNQRVYKNFTTFEKRYTGVLELSDPAVGENPGTQCLWRPYLDIEENCSLLVLSFPLPGSDVIAVLSTEGEHLPESDIISPYILAGLIRSFYDLKGRIEKCNPQTWSALDKTGHWARRGPYLSPLCSKKDYGKLFRQYLNSGILLSPEFSNPSICAVDIKEGTLKNILKSCNRGETL